MEEERGGEREGEICTSGAISCMRSLITVDAAAAGPSSLNSGGRSLPFGHWPGLFVLLWAVATVAGFNVVGTHVVVCIRICGRLLVVVRVCGWLVVIVHVRICGRLLVVVGVNICGWLVIVCTFAFGGSRWSLWAVGGRFGWPCRLLCAPMFMGVHGHGWSLVVIGGDCCGWWSPCVVDGGGKEKGSHVTHCDNGIRFE